MQNYHAGALNGAKIKRQNKGFNFAHTPLRTLMLSFTCTENRYPPQITTPFLTYDKLADIIESKATG